MGSVLAETLGRQLLHSDIWFLADKCANLVKRIHEPLERSVAVLDNILTLEDDDTNRSVSAAAENHNNILPAQHIQPRHRPAGVNVLGVMEHNIQVVDDYFNRQFFGKRIVVLDDLYGRIEYKFTDNDNLCDVSKPGRGLALSKASHGSAIRHM